MNEFNNKNQINLINIIKMNMEINIYINIKNKT